MYQWETGRDNQIIFSFFLPTNRLAVLLCAEIERSWDACNRTMFTTAKMNTPRRAGERTLTDWIMQTFGIYDNGHQRIVFKWVIQHQIKKWTRARDKIDDSMSIHCNLFICSSTRHLWHEEQTIHFFVHNCLFVVVVVVVDSRESMWVIRV